MKGDLYELLEAVSLGKLGIIQPEWREGYAVCIVLCSRGYPDHYEVGFPIGGIEEAEQIPGVGVFHAGTRRGNDSILCTAGGRVLNVTAIGAAFSEAIEIAYRAVACIHFEGMHYRNDIGKTFSVDPMMR